MIAISDKMKQCYTYSPIATPVIVTCSPSIFVGTTYKIATINLSPAASKVSTSALSTASGSFSLNHGEGSHNASEDIDQPADSEAEASGNKQDKGKGKAKKEGSEADDDSESDLESPKLPYKGKGKKKATEDRNSSEDLEMLRGFGTQFDNFSTREGGDSHAESSRTFEDDSTLVPPRLAIL